MLSPLSLSLSLSLSAVSMSQSPWTYSAPMELPLTRSLNSSSSESSIDSGFESPLSKSESVVSPLSAVSAGSFQDAISTSCAVTNMLVSTKTLEHGVHYFCLSMHALHVGLYSMHGTLACVWEGSPKGMCPLPAACVSTVYWPWLVAYTTSNSNCHLWIFKKNWLNIPQTRCFWSSSLTILAVLCIHNALV